MYDFLFVQLMPFVNKNNDLGPRVSTDELNTRCEMSLKTLFWFAGLTM
jgi:hypothetical protein